MVIVRDTKEVSEMPLRGSCRVNDFAYLESVTRCRRFFSARTLRAMYPMRRMRRSRSPWGPPLPGISSHWMTVVTARVGLGLTQKSYQTFGRDSLVHITGVATCPQLPSPIDIHYHQHCFLLEGSKIGVVVAADGKWRATIRRLPPTAQNDGWSEEESLFTDCIAHHRIPTRPRRVVAVHGCRSKLPPPTMIWNPFVLLFTAMALKQPMVIVFGPPGAGKSTIADRASDLATQPLQALDLDVCVPQWMKDNFAQGIYPTLEQRIEFAQQASDYVLLQQQTERPCLISFSFVNTDLRDVFRKAFPEAQWALVDVPETELQRRIQEREGHFYKGKQQSTEETIQPKDHDNSDWEFAPVTFPHTVLNGLRPIDENAQVVLSLLEQTR